jgi:Uma2 family endonuclease
VERFAAAIETDDSARIQRRPRIPIPPGAVALDGIEVDVLVAVFASEPTPAAAPELVVELWSSVRQPRLHLLAWRSLHVPEVWRVHADEGWIEVVRPTGGQSQRVGPGGRVVSHGTGWRADFAVDTVVAGA